MTTEAKSELSLNMLCCWDPKRSVNKLPSCTKCSDFGRTVSQTSRYILVCMFFLSTNKLDLKCRASCVRFWLVALWVGARSFGLWPLVDEPRGEIRIGSMSRLHDNKATPRAKLSLTVVHELSWVYRSAVTGAGMRKLESVQRLCCSLKSAWDEEGNKLDRHFLSLNRNRMKRAAKPQEH